MCVLNNVFFTEKIFYETLFTLSRFFLTRKIINTHFWFINTLKLYYNFRELLCNIGLKSLKNLSKKKTVYIILSSDNSNRYEVF